MQANVIGRVRNTRLPKSQALLPLFEAIVNSIEAIEDRHGEPNDGQIQIRILRRATLGLPGEGDDPRAHDPIHGFEITDDGVGFDDADFQAFDEADTQYKAHRGGKGIGRFIWLAAFDHVEVDSSFQAADRLAQRTFVFSLASVEGVSSHRLNLSSDVQKQRTIVRLLGFKEEYERAAPRGAETIAQRIVEHCLEYFVLGRVPTVILYDGDKEPIDLDRVYDGLVATDAVQTEAMEIRGVLFEVSHFMLHAASGLNHQVCYCANRRVVRSEKIGSKVPNLPSVLCGDEGGPSFVYAGYVSSQYLDNNVNPQRTDFQTMPDDGFLISGELSWAEIEDGVLARAKAALEPFTEKVRVDKERRFHEYVNNHAPEYRPIIQHHPERLDQIAPDVSDEKLDTQLYEISRTIERELRSEAEVLFDAVLTGDDISYEQRLAQFSQWWEETNGFGKASLAKYITHRKLVLTYLEKALKLQGSGKYSREEVIHQMVFPVKRTSDDVAYDQHNLWIIDEKLAYHEYLASDIALKDVEVLESGSPSRPDLILFFDRAIAVVDGEQPYNSGIVIFEFKRPMRDDYTDDENPISQVLEYVLRIREGRALTKDGRPVPVHDRIPFYCYIIADLTQGLIKQARFANLRSTPDNAGFFGYLEELGAYVEVISFDKLVGDANKRNRVLFGKLNLPDRI
jgi:hypothetical protein